MYKVAVLTISDKCSKKEREDKSGKVIQEIQAETNSTITIDEVDNVGLVDVFAVLTEFLGTFD